MNQFPKTHFKWFMVAGLVIVCLMTARNGSLSTVPDGLHPMPPKPELNDDVSTESLTSSEADKLERGIDVPEYKPNPPSGDFKLLVVLVDFPDKPARLTDISGLQLLDDLFFDSHDSVADYYNEISHGLLTLTVVDLPGDLGWQRAPRDYNDNSCGDLVVEGYVNADCITGTSDDYGWGSYPNNLQGIVDDIVPLIDDEIDFSQYDNDGDGYVDGVVFVHAGEGAEGTNSAADIWSATWDMSSGNGPGPISTGDGVYVDSFAFGPELSDDDIALPATIGVYAHELGHMLFGLPDLYDLDDSSSGIGNWSLMSYGAWLGIPSGSKPAWPDAWSRIRMGFESPQVITQNTNDHEFLPVENNPGNVVKLWSPRLRGEEYFLVEYRKNLGDNYDYSLPGSGLLIWHVDEAKWNRWDLNQDECESSPCCGCVESHALLALEQADGLLHLENKNNKGDPSDPFPGTLNRTTFDSGSNPESGSYYASTCPEDSCIALENITTGSGLISADLKVICQAQGACVNILADRMLGWAEARESLVYEAEIQNCGDATDFLTLSSEGDWQVGLIDLESGEPVSSGRDVPAGGVWKVGISVSVPADELWNTEDVINLTATSTIDANISTTTQLTTRVPYCTLVVDDDGGAPDVEGAYIDALIGAGYDFDLWDTEQKGSPDEATLAAHRAVLWFTGVSNRNTLTPHNESALISYLDDGGSFFFSSQEYLADTLLDYFGRTYLQVSTFIDNASVDMVMGVPGNPLSNELGPYTIADASLSDRMEPLSSELSAFKDESGNTYAITNDPGPWQTLFLGWPFEGLALTDGEELIASTLDWMSVPPRPVVSFEPSANAVCEGEAITFTNTSSYAIHYLWDFGDGNASTESDGLHVYDSSLTATVTLTGTNSCGYATAMESITIYDTPRLDFTPSTDTLYVYKPVTFVVLDPVIEILTLTWDFGDGTIVSGVTNPTHTFTQSGWQTVTLRASDDRCAGVTSQEIYLNLLQYYLPLTVNKPDGSPLQADD